MMKGRKWKATDPLALGPETSRTVLAMGLMLASMACFSAMNIIIRYASYDMHTTQIVFFRNLFSLLFFLPWIIRSGPAVLKTRKPLSHFWRGTIGVIGMQLWFYCVAILPLNEATALSFTAPIFTSIIAILFLGETAGWHRWGAIFIGFFGTLIIIRPDPGNMNWDLLIVPLATTMWAVAGTLVKHMTKTESSKLIVFYMALTMCLWSFPVALPHWQTPSLSLIGLCLLIALSSTGAHLCMVNAYARADVVVLMPFDFFRLVFTAIFAYLAFGEQADLWSWCGGLIIVASAVYISYRETVRQHRAGKVSAHDGE